MMQSAPVLALMLEISGQCVDQGRVLSLIQNEIDMASRDAGSNEALDRPGVTSAPSPSAAPVAEAEESPPPEASLSLHIRCEAGQASFTLTSGTRHSEGRVSLEGLDQDLRERTLALAIAEAFPLLEEPGPVPLGSPATAENDAAGEASSSSLATPKAESPPQQPRQSAGASPADSESTEFEPTEPEPIESQALAGGYLRIYPSGVVMMGGTLDLRIRRVGLSATLLSTGGTVTRYNSAYTNLSLAASYVVIQVGSDRIKGDWGAKVAGGFTSSDTILRGYVGISAFAAADVSVTRTWRTRLEAEVGHAGWSQHEQLKQAQGFYVGAMLALGVGGSL